jgi:hypothetical protein
MSCDLRRVSGWSTAEDGTLVEGNIKVYSYPDQGTYDLDFGNEPLDIILDADSNGLYVTLREFMDDKE